MARFNNLQTFICLLLPLAALGGTVPLHSANTGLPETSGEELQELQEVAETPGRKWHDIAKRLHLSIKTIRDEQFQRDFGEPVNNMTNFATVRIQTLPGNRSVCFSKNFDGDRCLKRIYTGLSLYREYLTYVERANITALISVRHLTTRLLNIIKDKLMEAPDHALPVLALPDGSAWTRRIVTHSILYDFDEFMAETSRAINFMNKSIKGKRYDKKATQQ